MGLSSISGGPIDKDLPFSFASETPASCYDKRRSGLTSAQQIVGYIRQEQMFLVQEMSLEAIAR